MNGLKISDALKQFKANNPRAEVWMRGFYRTGAIFAFRNGEKGAAPVNCFVIFNNGTIQHGQHHDLAPMMIGSEK